MKAALRRRSGLWLTGLVLLLVSVCSIRIAGPLLVVSASPDAPQAIVSLASHEWERLPEAARLARQYPAAVVLLTVPRRVTEQNCYRCSERRDFLAREGVEPDRIHILSDRVSNTRDEAAACLAYLRTIRPTEIIVVTSPYHTRRALATFRRVFEGIEVKIGIRPAVTNSPARPHRWWREPYDRAYVAYEWAAIVYYAFRFGVYPWST